MKRWESGEACTWLRAACRTELCWQKVRPRVYRSTERKGVKFQRGPLKGIDKEATEGVGVGELRYVDTAQVVGEAELAAREQPVAEVVPLRVELDRVERHLERREGGCASKVMGIQQVGRV